MSIGGEVRGVERQPLGSAAALLVAARSGVVDEHASHQARGDAHEVRAILPLNVTGAGEAEKRFVHERGRLERVAFPLAPHAAARQSPQLGFNQRHELAERAVVAVAPRSQQLRDGPRGRWHRALSVSADARRFIERFPSNDPDRGAFPHSIARARNRVTRPDVGRGSLRVHGRTVNQRRSR
jgi:hypothetical protein